MGHSYREMNPGSAEARDRHINRLLELRKKVENVPLSNFTVGELASLLRILGVETSFSNQASSEDMDTIEKKLRQLKKAKEG